MMEMVQNNNPAVVTSPASQISISDFLPCLAWSESGDQQSWLELLGPATASSDLSVVSSPSQDSWLGMGEEAARGSCGDSVGLSGPRCSRPRLGDRGSESCKYHGIIVVLWYVVWCYSVVHSVVYSVVYGVVLKCGCDVVL